MHLMTGHAVYYMRTQVDRREQRLGRDKIYFETPLRTKKKSVIEGNSLFTCPFVDAKWQLRQNYTRRDFRGEELSFI